MLPASWGRPGSVASAGDIFLSIWLPSASYLLVLTVGRGRVIKTLYITLFPSASQIRCKNCPTHPCVNIQINI
jgi:hypothetical protein